MAGATDVRRAGGLAVALLLAGVAAPPAVTAADPDAALALPGTTVVAVVADLDNDGSSELVRLVDRTVPGFDLEAWAADDEGWSVAATGELVPPQDPETQAAFGEVGSLLTVRVGDRDRVLALTGSYAGGDSEISPSPCCLEIREARISGGRVTLQPVAAHDGADFVQPVDLDGDGTDELMTQLTTWQDPEDEGSFRLNLHRRVGDRYEPAFEMERPARIGGGVVGDADGRPGEEVYMAVTENGDLQRLVHRDGEIVVEDGHIDLGEGFEAWVIGAANGVIVLQHPEGVRMLRWPRGGDLTEVGRISTMTFPSIGIVGEGADALVIAQDGFDFAGEARAVTTIYDLELRELGEIPMPEAARDLHDAMADLASRGAPLDGRYFPYSGPMPSGRRGPTEYLTNGVLVAPGEERGFETRPTRMLLGRFPVGRLGPDDSWLALHESMGGFYGRFGMQGGGTGLVPYATGPLTADTSLVLMPYEELVGGAAGVTTSVSFTGAVEVSRDGHRSQIVAPPDGFEATISAPPGTTVMTHDGVAVTEDEVGDEPLVIEVAPRRPNRESNVEFSRSVIVVTPLGDGSIVRWDGSFVAEPPTLDVAARSEAFSMRTTISGTASPGSSVVVGSHAAEVDATGAFSIDIDVPIWPIDVAVVASDPIGNETVAMLQVVGFLDYRGLPWIPILGVATVAAGAFLFMHTPKRRERQQLAWDGATLEEVDGD